MRELFNTTPQYVRASCCTGAVRACQITVKRYLLKEQVRGRTAESILLYKHAAEQNLWKTGHMQRQTIFCTKLPDANRIAHNKLKSFLAKEKNANYIPNSVRPRCIKQKINSCR